MPSLGSRLTTQAGKLKELLAFAKAVKTGFTSRAQHLQNTQAPNLTTTCPNHQASRLGLRLISALGLNKQYGCPCLCFVCKDFENDLASLMLETFWKQVYVCVLKPYLYHAISSRECHGASTHSGYDTCDMHKTEAHVPLSQQIISRKGQAPGVAFKMISKEPDLAVNRHCDVLHNWRSTCMRLSSTMAKALPQGFDKCTFDIKLKCFVCNSCGLGYKSSACFHNHACLHGSNQTSHTQIQRHNLLVKSINCGNCKTNCGFCLYKRNGSMYYRHKDWATCMSWHTHVHSPKAEHVWLRHDQTFANTIKHAKSCEIVMRYQHKALTAQNSDCSITRYRKYLAEICFDIVKMCVNFALVPETGGLLPWQFYSMCACYLLWSSFSDEQMSPEAHFAQVQGALVHPLVKF